MAASPQEIGAYIAWQEYYDRLGDTRKYVRGRGTCPQENKHYKHFLGIAERCLALDIDIREYVSATFAKLATTGSVLPRDINNAHLVQRHMDTLARVDGGNPKAWWDAQTQELQKMLLMDPIRFPDRLSCLRACSTPFEFWFRCTKLNPPAPILFEMFGAAGWHEINNDRLLLRFLRGMAPAALTELERRFALFGDG